ncbi:hypothetical protein KIN20_007175 [Parelaphostrongylus tenuis]|uniref:Uncharacterized protein n=1 Tax=Parelaphostrongylus tenuis TaxID=148309 RepID=A0AAD5QJU1_PARTN|nr:hypothetical protein KIN20_007175 [Parelaphostrongylus tenuis]
MQRVVREVLTDQCSDQKYRLSADALDAIHEVYSQEIQLHVKLRNECPLLITNSPLPVRHITVTV